MDLRYLSYMSRKESMLAITKSMALQGLKGYLVAIQVDISKGMPDFQMVGLPDTSIKESKERVKTAIRNTNIEFLSRKVVINLSPANTRKEGSMFDLPIAIGILIANGNIKNSKLRKNIKRNYFYRRIIFKWKHRKSKRHITSCHRSKKIRHKKSNFTKTKCRRSQYIRGNRDIASS